MREAVRVREATIKDAAALREYVSQIFLEQLPTILEHSQLPTVEEERVFIANCSGSGSSVLLIADLDGQIAGMLDLQGYGHPQRRHCGCLGMSVSSRRRGRGIGTKLLHHLFDWAPSHSISRVELEVLSNNTDAIRLYEHLGFQHEGVRRKAVAIGDGYLDLVQMARIEGASDQPPMSLTGGQGVGRTNS